jgi:hypothetical protein
MQNELVEPFGKKTSPYHAALIAASSIYLCPAIFRIIPLICMRELLFLPACLESSEID